jgi:hypothetical protein
MTDIDIHSKVEDAVIDLLKAGSDTGQYNVVRHYGAYSAELFVDEIKTKVNTGVPVLMVSARNLQSDRAMDTRDMVHRANLTLDIVCAANIIREKEMDVSRLTSLMMGQVKKQLSGSTVEINERTVSLSWTSEENLFRINQLNLDAQRVTYTLRGIMLYLT